MPSSDSDPVRAVNEGRRVGIISTRHRALGVFSLFSAQLGSLSGGVSPSSGGESRRRHIARPSGPGARRNAPQRQPPQTTAKPAVLLSWLSCHAVTAATAVTRAALGGLDALSATPAVLVALASSVMVPARWCLRPSLRNHSAWRLMLAPAAAPASGLTRETNQMLASAMANSTVSTGMSAA